MTRTGDSSTSIQAARRGMSKQMTSWVKLPRTRAYAKSMSIVASGSVMSRVSSFLLLAYAARILSLSEFAIFAMVIASTISFANLFVAGLGDMIAGTAVRDPQRLQRSAKVAIAASFGSVFLGILSEALTAHYSIVLATTSLFAATFVSATTMQTLRGVCSGSEAGIYGFYLPAAMRVTILLLPGNLFNLTSLIGAVALTAAVAGTASALKTSHAVHRAVAQVNSRVGKAVVNLQSAAVLGVVYLVLNQADTWAVSTTIGLEAAGTFIPQMRLFEALGALAIATKFTSTKQSFESRITRMSPIKHLLASYTLAASLLIVFGGHLTALILGESATWSYLNAVLLAAAYGFSSVSSVIIQYCIADHEWGKICSAGILTICVAALTLTTLTQLLGLLGVVVADLLIFGVWTSGLLLLPNKIKECHA